MWSTHPASDVREENAKREYVSCALDDRSAWSLFEDEQRVRRDVTAQLYETIAKANRAGIAIVGLTFAGGILLLLEASLPEAEARAILSGNAAELLGSRLPARATARVGVTATEGGAA